MHAMSTLYRNLIIGVVAAFGIGALGYAVLHKNASLLSGSEASSTPLSTASGVTATGNPTVIEQSVTGNVLAPNSHLSLTFDASVSADVKTALNAQFVTIQKMLASNPTSFDAWMDLGIIRKMAGDYPGAAEDWEYVSAIYPRNNVSFYNLGDLYTNFLQNYPKAATALKKEVANDPKNVNAYLALFQLYTNQYPAGSSDPVGFMRAAIAQNPKSVDLHLALARYFVAQKDTASAKAEYEAAISLAQAAGDANTVQALRSEEPK